MSTPDEPESPQLTRRQLRELRNTASTPVITPEEAAAAAAAVVAPLPRAAEPAPIDAEPPVEADIDLTSPALTRREARQQERLRTASVPIIGDDDVPLGAPADLEAADADHADHVAPAEHEHDEAPEHDESEAREAASDTDADADAEAHATAGEPDVAEADGERDADADADDNADGAEHDGEPDAGPESGTSESESESDAQDEHDADGETDADREPDADAASDDGTDGEPEAASDAGAETDAELLFDAEHEAGADAKAEQSAVVAPTFGSELLAGEGIEVELPASFDQLLSRGSSATGSLAASNALILSQTPETASLAGPIAATGEVLITGTYNLPESFGSTGTSHGSSDGKEIDAVLVDGELPPASSPTPIAASSAISTIKSAEDIIKPPVPEKGSRLMLALVITAGALALALTGVLIVALVTGAVG